MKRKFFLACQNAPTPEHAPVSTSPSSAQPLPKPTGPEPNSNSTAVTDIDSDASSPMYSAYKFCGRQKSTRILEVEMHHGRNQKQPPLPLAPSTLTFPKIAMPFREIPVAFILNSNRKCQKYFGKVLQFFSSSQNPKSACTLSLSAR